MDGIEAPELEVAIPKPEDEGGSVKLAVASKTGAGESPGKFTTPILGSKAPASRAAKVAKRMTAVKAMSKGHTDEINPRVDVQAEFVTL